MNCGEISKNFFFPNIFLVFDTKPNEENLNLTLPCTSQLLSKRILFRQAFAICGLTQLLPVSNRAPYQRIAGRSFSSCRSDGATAVVLLRQDEDRYLISGAAKCVLFRIKFKPTEIARCTARGRERDDLLICKLKKQITTCWLEREMERKWRSGVSITYLFDFESRIIRLNRLVVQSRR